MDEKLASSMANRADGDVETTVTSEAQGENVIDTAGGQETKLGAKSGEVLGAADDIKTIVTSEVQEEEVVETAGGKETKLGAKSGEVLGAADDLKTTVTSEVQEEEVVETAGGKETKLGARSGEVLKAADDLKTTLTSEAQEEEVVDTAGGKETKLGATSGEVLSAADDDSTCQKLREEAPAGSENTSFNGKSSCDAIGVNQEEEVVDTAGGQETKLGATSGEVLRAADNDSTCQKLREESPAGSENTSFNGKSSCDAIGVNQEEIRDAGNLMEIINNVTKSLIGPRDIEEIEAMKLTRFGRSKKHETTDDLNVTQVEGEEEEGAVGGAGINLTPQKSLLYDRDIICNIFVEKCIQYKDEPGFILDSNDKFTNATNLMQDLVFFCKLFLDVGSTMQLATVRANSVDANLHFQKRVTQYNVEKYQCEEDKVDKDRLTLERVASILPQCVCSLLKSGIGEVPDFVASLGVPVPRAMQTIMFAAICPSGPPGYCYYFCCKLKVEYGRFRPSFKIDLADVKRHVDTVFHGIHNSQSRQDMCVQLELASVCEDGWHWNKEVADALDAGEKAWAQFKAGKDMLTEEDVKWTFMDKILNFNIDSELVKMFGCRPMIGNNSDTSTDSDPDLSDDPYYV